MRRQKLRTQTLLTNCVIICSRTPSIKGGWTWWLSTSREAGTTACPATTSTARSAWAAGPTPGPTSVQPYPRNTSHIYRECTSQSTTSTSSSEGSLRSPTRTAWWDPSSSASSEISLLDSRKATDFSTTSEPIPISCSPLRSCKKLENLIWQDLFVTTLT